MRERQRISIEEARPLIGLPIRTIRKLAATGEILGAAKMGRRWTFDVEKLQRWIEYKERETRQNAQRHRPDVTGDGLPCGVALKSMVADTDGLLTQTIRRLRENDSRQARLASSLTSGMATASGRSKKRSSPGRLTSPDKSSTAPLGRKLRLVTSADRKSTRLNSSHLG